MKAYTDIDQSKRLAEILPPESADMKWCFWKTEIDAPKLPTFGYSNFAAENFKDTELVYLPCWSLAALLEIIPNAQLSRMPEDSKKWECALWDEIDFEPKLSVEGFSNSVDACYEIIVKLKEKNLL